MTIKEVDKQVEEWCKRTGFSYERDENTHQYTFTDQPLTMHLSHGINNGQRNYTKESVEDKLSQVMAHFTRCHHMRPWETL